MEELSHCHAMLEDCIAELSLVDGWGKAFLGCSCGHLSDSRACSAGPYGFVVVMLELLNKPSHLMASSLPAEFLQAPSALLNAGLAGLLRSCLLTTAFAGVFSCLSCQNPVHCDALTKPSLFVGHGTLLSIQQQITFVHQAAHLPHTVAIGEAALQGFSSGVRAAKYHQS